MPTEKMVARPTDGGGEAIATLEAREPIAHALQQLHRALHKTAIYPIGHPSIGSAIRNAHAELVRALAGRGSVLIGVARTHLLVDRNAVQDPPAMLASLAQLLHDLDVAAVELKPDLSVEELERFLLRLREARHSGRGGAALAVTLTEDKLENVRIFPLDYWGLSFGSHMDAERAENFDELWESLVLNLSDLGQGTPAFEPETLAEEANHQFVSNEGLGASALRDRFQSFGRQTRGMEDWQRDALRARIGRFVGALNPSLRQDLLRVNPERPEEAFELITELADTLEDATLLDVLRDINRNGQNAHDQFLNFLNKMARLPTSRSEASVDLEAVARRWHVSTAVHEKDGDSFRAALHEVLLRRREIESNPGSYQTLLDDLTHRELPPTTRRILHRYRNPADDNDVRSQALELAVYLLQEGTSDEHVPGILAHLGAATDPLLDIGRFPQIRDAVAAARSVLTREHGSEASRLAASGYLRDFTAPPRIDRILDGTVHAEGVSGAIEPLLLLGGRAALDRIVERLDTNLPAHAVPVLQSVVVNLGRDAMAHVIATRVESWARLRPALGLIRLWPANEALSLIEGLASHADPRVRKEVLTLRCELAPSQEAVELHLEAALGDADPGIVVFAVQNLFALATEGTLRILGAYLECALPCGPPSPALVLRIARTMLAMRGDGLLRVCAALDALGMKLRPSRARVGGILRALLEAEAPNPAVAACLGRWRRSPGCLVSRFLTPVTPPPEVRE